MFLVPLHHVPLKTGHGINLLPAYHTFTIAGRSSMGESQYPALSIQRLYWLLSHMLPCHPALTLRGLLSARDNMPELNGVSSPGHFSLILISLPLTFYDCLYEPVYLYLPLLSTVSPGLLLLSLFFSSSILTFPSISPLNPPPPLSSSYYDRSSALACLGPSALSSGIPYVAPLSSSSSSVLLSPLPTVAVPLAPVSRGRQSAIGPLWSGEPQRLQSDPRWLGDIFKRWC